MSSVSVSNPSAGSAEPYWFEWKIGLLKLIELLDEDSEVLEVAFQLYGAKGWDDVGVHLKDGRTQLFQIKHSRVDARLTFGDIVSESEGESSLLNVLANAWKNEKKARGSIECILITNREAGINWYQDRPPLEEFFNKVKARVDCLSSLDQIDWKTEDPRYLRAWDTFLKELDELDLQEKLEFLKSLRVETGVPDLEGLEVTIRDRLSILTGLPPSSINGLFNAIYANLPKWTCQSKREKEWINREALLACLACDENVPKWLGHCEVETREPFFPSREITVNSLCDSLLSDSDHKIDFLAAEPGAGKTSCISKLARRSAVLWKEQCVSIRFYAYRPIRPDQPDIGNDSGIGVLPEVLWSGLLWQIRDNLRKTCLLSELSVPVWLGDMPWLIAREHVLRIGSELGKRWGRSFVICIDGIDHAARARRRHLPEFLQTLPSPSAIPPHVRFLLAGQPADAYPEYPSFLKQEHAAVKIHFLDILSDEDIRELWRASKPQISYQSEDAIIRLLQEKAQCRTLPTVYAVEDIRTSTTFSSAVSVLNARPLADSLNNYYDSIWSVSTETISNRNRLAAAFVLLRERPTGKLMASAFSEVGKSTVEWMDIMRRLRPLVRETDQGFEMLHNDLRVHLEASLINEPFLCKEVAAALAKHYRNPESNRLAAHLSLLDLLIAAGQRDNFSNDFTVDWVIEANEVGISSERLALECKEAFASAVVKRDWLLLHSVGCASLTLYRLNECLSNSGNEHFLFESKIAPAFLAAEGEPAAFELWGINEFSEILNTCEQLLNCGVKNRAILVFRQWFENISVVTLVEKLVKINNEIEDSNEQILLKEFERFGRLCALFEFQLVSINNDEKKHQYFVNIEKGLVRGLSELPNRRMALRYWCKYKPRYITSWVFAVKTTANHNRWSEVRALLDRMGECAEKLDKFDCLMLGWYAARAKPKNSLIWQRPLALQNYGLDEGKTPLRTLQILAQWITYENVSREPTQVSEDLIPLLEQQRFQDKHQAALSLTLRASAIQGRILRYYDRNDFRGAFIAVPAAVVERFLEVMWCCVQAPNAMPHEEHNVSRETGASLAKVVSKCGEYYHQVLSRLAKKRFPDVMLWPEGISLFDMLLDYNEHDFLKNIVVSKALHIVEYLHEEEVSSRSELIKNLLYFTKKLEIDDISEQLKRRFYRTRIGYVAHKEWFFYSLIQKFKFLRRFSPVIWRTYGMHLMSFDRICEQQEADNSYSEELISEVGASAMSCGSGEFKLLFDFLITRKSKHQLRDLTKAIRNGFEICLQEQQVMTEESICARVAICIALGKWPRESALITVKELHEMFNKSEDVVQKTAWQKALDIALEMQGNFKKGEQVVSSNKNSNETSESKSVEEIFQEIIKPKEPSFLRLQSIADLADKARKESHPNRDELVKKALEAFSSADVLSRYIDFYNIDLMSQLYRNFSESERWQLMDEITKIVGDMRMEMSDPNWAFSVASSAVDLICLVRAEEMGQTFAETIFQRSLETHAKWHGSPLSVSPIPESNSSDTWLDTARHILLSLLQTDACETFYMAISGLRFFGEVFPDQIPLICSEGLSNENSRDAIIPLAQLWATRWPDKIDPVLRDFSAYERIGLLDERLDAWAVGALNAIMKGNSPSDFPLFFKNNHSEVILPEGVPLFEGESHSQGLMRHSTFSNMANARLRRAGNVLGSMEKAFAYLKHETKKEGFEFPSSMLPPPKKLAFDSMTPRHRYKTEHIIGDSILYQCSGEKWSSAKAAAVRLFIGYGIDPWIVSTTPHIWPENKTWPSQYDIEGWFKDGAAKEHNVYLNLMALLKGDDLDKSLLLLGSSLHLPTYKHDLRFDSWLVAPGVVKNKKSMSAAGRTLAAWLANWSFASLSPVDHTTVRFVGALINYPNSDLDIIPTDEWRRKWNWKIDSRNNLRFLSEDGTPVAWYERWLGPEPSSRRVLRQPILNRWVARRNGFPCDQKELREWTQQIDFTSGELHE